MIRYGTERYFISTAIAGWSVGIKPQSNGLIEVWFSRLLLGHIAPDTASFLAVRTDSQEAGQPDDKQCNL
jgi:hypothetical protein